MSQTTMILPPLSTTIDGFISDIIETVAANQKKDTFSCIYASKQYHITDAIHSEERIINISDVRILTTMSIVFAHISIKSFNVRNFDLSLKYHPNGRADAEILNMQRSEKLSGTETMLLIDYILSRMGIQSVSWSTNRD